VSGIHGAEQARARVVADGIKALESQAARATAVAKVTSAQEALELQQQFARQALESYVASATAVSSALTSAFQAALKPLNDRYAEVAKAVAKA
jgi:hypothetical protein